MATDEAKAANITSGQQWPITVKLAHPIEFGKSTIDELVFQRGTLGMMRGIVPGTIPPADDLMRVASMLCGHSVKVIEKLDPDDAGEVLAIALGFIGRCQKGGS